MSQFWQGVSEGSLPPVVATSYVEDSGTAVPAANILNVIGANGISTSGSGNTITITLDETILEGSGVTVGAVTADLITIAMPPIAGTYQFESRVKGYDITTPASAGYNVYTTVRATGVAAIVVNNQGVFNEDSILETADAYFIAVGNDIILRVLGVAGETINWSATTEIT